MELLLIGVPIWFAFFAIGTARKRPNVKPLYVLYAIITVSVLSILLLVSGSALYLLAAGIVGLMWGVLYRALDR